MPALLHILTKPDDALAAQIISAQKTKPENKIEVVDLTKPDSDYKALVEKIFESDSIQVW